MNFAAHVARAFRTDMARAPVQNATRASDGTVGARLQPAHRSARYIEVEICNGRARKALALVRETVDELRRVCRQNR